MLKFVRRLFASIAELSNPRNFGPGPSHFDFKVEPRPLPHGVIAVNGLADIGALFRRAALRHQIQNARLRNGTTPLIATNSTALGYDPAASHTDAWLQ
jgi:hypothetical protein